MPSVGHHAVKEFVLYRNGVEVRRITTDDDSARIEAEQDGLSYTEAQVWKIMRSKAASSPPHKLSTGRRIVGTGATGIIPHGPDEGRLYTVVHYSDGTSGQIRDKTPEQIKRKMM